MHWAAGPANGATYQEAIDTGSTDLKVKVWAASSSEPDTWTVETTDASLHSGIQLTAGRFGVFFGASSASPTSRVMYIDDFTACIQDTLIADDWTASSGSESDLVTPASITLSAGTNYEMRFLVETNGSNADVKVKVWATGSAEPGTWTVAPCRANSKLHNRLACMCGERQDASPAGTGGSSLAGASRGRDVGTGTWSTPCQWRESFWSSVGRFRGRPRRMPGRSLSCCSGKT